MAKCDVCGNDYDKPIFVTQGDKAMTFDSFECAIEAMAPRCAHCGCRVIGHGVEAEQQIYCCAHCSEQSGIVGLKDRATDQCRTERYGYARIEGQPVGFKRRNMIKPRSGLPGGAFL